MSPLEPTITVGPEYCSIAEVQENDLKRAFVNMIEALNKEMNKDLK